MDERQKQIACTCSSTHYAPPQQRALAPSKLPLRGAPTRLSHEGQLARHSHICLRSESELERGFLVMPLHLYVLLRVCLCVCACVVFLCVRQRPENAMRLVLGQRTGEINDVQREDSTDSRETRSVFS